MKSLIVIAGIAAAVSLGDHALLAGAPNKRSDAFVNIKAKLEPAAAGKAVVALSVDIAKGYHLLANPVGLEELEPGRIEVRAVDADAKFEYPPGKLVKDDLLGNYKIYENRVEIRGLIGREVNAEQPVKIRIRLQIYDDKGCVPPATVTLTVP